MSNLTSPGDFREVSHERFYEVVGPLDVTVRPEKNYCAFETRQRVLVGYATPGYMCEGRRAYFLTESRA